MMMTTPGIPEAAPLGWQTQQQYWGRYFEQRLYTQLRWAVEHARASRHDPVYLQRHWESFLTLLRKSRQKSKLHPLSLDLITALHPWPLRWGYWADWKRECRFAAQVSAEMHLPAQQAAFLGYLSGILFAIGQVDEATKTGGNALSLARETRAVSPLMNTGEILVAILLNQGKQEAARQLLYRLDADLKQWQPHISPREYTIGWARLTLQQTVFLRLQGRSTEAIALASQAVEGLKRLMPQDIHLLADAHKHRATMYWAQGQYALAIRDLKYALEFYSQEGDIYAEGITSGNLGLVYWSISELDNAEQSLLRSVKTTEQLNARWRLTVDVGNLGLVYLSRGQLDQALRYIQRQISLAEQTGHFKEQVRGYDNRGIVYLMQGRLREALADFTRYSDSVKQEQSPEGIGCGYVNLSWCYADLGETSRAVQLAHDALAIADEIHAASLKTIALRCLAEYETGEQKISILREALSLAKSLDRKLDEAGCCLALSAAVPLPEEKTSCWNTGVALLQKIGATAWLKEHSPENPPRIALML